MSKVLDALRKRRCRPVDLGDGDKVFIRSMTRGEILTSKEIGGDDELGAELRGNFIFGCVLVDEGGKPLFPRDEGETDIIFTNRVAEEMDAVPEETKMAILRALNSINTVPPLETIAKN